MITKDLAINQIQDRGHLTFDIRLSGKEPATQDKRSESRNYKHFQLICKTYNIQTDTFEIYDGIAKNCSASGLYFETKNPLQPSDPVCLLLRDQLLDSGNGEFAKGVHAQVVWCKFLNKDINPRYGIGVKYFEPIETHVSGA